MTHDKMASVQPGDLVEAWVLSGTTYNGTEHSPIYGLVKRVNRKTVSVVWTHSGRFQRVDPDQLTDVFKPDHWLHRELCQT